MVACLLFAITAIGLAIHCLRTRQRKTALLRQINPAAQYGSENAGDSAKTQPPHYGRGRRSEGRKQPLSMLWRGPGL